MAEKRKDKWNVIENVSKSGWSVNIPAWHEAVDPASTTDNPIMSDLP